MMRGMAAPAREENSIWRRLEEVVETRGAGLTRELAEEVLGVKPQDWERELMEELGAKARAGTLTEEETAEAELWARRGHVLVLAQGRARRWLEGRDG